MPKFFYPILRMVNDGNLIRNFVSGCLRLAAILTYPAGAYLLIEILKISFRLETEGTIGGLIFSAVFGVTVLMISQVYWYRADSIRDLGESPFTIIPIVSVLFRAIGEVQAVLCAAVGVGGCLFLWFAKLNPLHLLGGLAVLLPTHAAEGSFLGGILFLLYLSFFSMANLVGFYFLAEASVVVVDIARQLRTLSPQTAPEWQQEEFPQ